MRNARYRRNPTTINEDVDQTLDLLEKDQIENKLKETQFPEQTEAVNDIPNQSPWTESGQGAYGSETKGSEEIEHAKNPHSFTHEPIDESAIKKGLGLKDVKSGGGTN